MLKKILFYCAAIILCVSTNIWAVGGDGGGCPGNNPGNSFSCGNQQYVCCYQRAWSGLQYVPGSCASVGAQDARADQGCDGSSLVFGTNKTINAQCGCR